MPALEAGWLVGQERTIAKAAMAMAIAAPAPHFQRDDDPVRSSGVTLSEAGAGASSAKRAASRSMWVASFPEKTSTHCVPEMNN